MSAPEELRAFVGGATGYTGRAVVKELVRRSVEVVAHVRPDSSRLEHWKREFGDAGARVDTTPWDLEAMTQTLGTLTPTHVFSLLGTTRARAKGEGMEANEAYERIDYGLTALLIEASARSGCRPVFVYLSAIGVSDGTSNPYMRARVRAEAKLKESGLPFIIARPSFISGSDREESRPLERVSATVADASLRLAGFLGARRLRDRYQSLSADELARGLVTAALDESKVGKTIHAEALRGE